MVKKRQPLGKRAGNYGKREACQEGGGEKLGTLVRGRGRKKKRGDNTQRKKTTRN